MTRKKRGKVVRACPYTMTSERLGGHTWWRVKGPGVNWICAAKNGAFDYNMLLRQAWRGLNEKCQIRPIPRPAKRRRK